MYIWYQCRAAVGILNLGGPFSLASRRTQLGDIITPLHPKFAEGVHNRVPSSPHLEVPQARHQITNSPHMSRADAIPAVHACHGAVICAILRC